MGGAISDLLLEWYRRNNSARADRVDDEHGLHEPDQSELDSVERSDQLQRAAFDHQRRAVHFDRQRGDHDKLHEHGPIGRDHVLLRSAGGELSGMSGNSSQASTTTVAAAPAGLTATAASGSQINLSWMASTGATSYNVLRSTTSGGPYAQGAYGVTSTSYSDTGLTALITYYYVVQAVDAGGTSANSSPASATTQVQSVSVTISPTSVALAPNATQQFTATVTGSSNTAVTWEVNGVTGGNSTTGTVSTSGLYTAPATVPNPANVTVTAVLQADTTKSASATVTISNGLAFYVSTTGNDANSGSSGSPWRTIQQAANAAQPGDTIYVYGGTYNEAVTINVSGNSSAGYITFRSYPGQTVIVDGTGV